MNSRARFSLGLPTRLPPPSSHSSMAGSTAIACANARKSPVPRRRWLAFWIAIRLAKRTFWMLVAKWPCQNHVMRSGNGRSAAAIRSSHQPTSWVRCCCSACADAGSFGTRSTAANGGSGCGGGACVGARRGEGVERGVEPGGGGGVQLAPARAETPAAGAGGGRRRAHRSGSCRHGGPTMFEQCQESGTRRGSSEARAVEGHTVGRMARASGFCWSWRSRCSGGARARRPRGRGRRRRPTRRRWPPAGQGRRDRPGQLHHPARGAGVPGLRAVRGGGRQRRAGDAGRGGVGGGRGCARRPPPGGWPTRWASSAARLCRAHRAWPGRPRRSAATRCRRSRWTSPRCAPSSPAAPAHLRPPPPRASLRSTRRVSVSRDGESPPMFSARLAQPGGDDGGQPGRRVVGSSPGRMLMTTPPADRRRRPPPPSRRCHRRTARPRRPGEQRADRPSGRPLLVHALPRPADGDLTRPHPPRKRSSAARAAASRAARRVRSSASACSHSSIPRPCG